MLSFLLRGCWPRAVGRGFAPVAQLFWGPSGGQAKRGACRSKGLVVGEHVPDRFAEAAADLDRGDDAARFLPCLLRIVPRAGGRAGGSGRRRGLLRSAPSAGTRAVLAQR